MKNSSKKIAILSGKGGTGKTLVSVNLAALAEKSVYIDCDVEEPNGYLFFKPSEIIEDTVTVKIPVVKEKLCNGCRKCVDFCAFNALALIKGKPFLFKEVCHSCGGCVLVCPEKALSEKEKIIGKTKKGVFGSAEIFTGILNTGEASGIPIIKRLLKETALYENTPVFIDCPPGSACIVMESIKDADFCVLVAEPTIFGAHNLAMVYELVKLFDKPHGVILNKCLGGDNPSEKFCAEHGIPILGRIPFDNELGRLNSDAKIVVREDEKYRALFASLLKSVLKESGYETALDS